MDNGVLRSQRARGRFLLTVCEQAESRLAGGNRCGSENREDGEGWVIAHNGVRGDDDVEVREAREKPNHQSDEEEV
jgi:hypothetical protein